MAETVTRTIPRDTADPLRKAEDIAAHLKAAREQDDPEVIANARGNVARAQGMTEIAGRTGLSRESLYAALSGYGHPSSRRS